MKSMNTGGLALPAIIAGLAMLGIIFVRLFRTDHNLASISGPPCTQHHFKDHNFTGIFFTGLIK